MLMKEVAGFMGQSQGFGIGNKQKISMMIMGTGYGTQVSISRIQMVIVSGMDQN